MSQFTRKINQNTLVSSYLNLEDLKLEIDILYEIITHLLDNSPLEASISKISIY
jgi:hypothetical protein